MELQNYLIPKKVVKEKMNMKQTGQRENREWDDNLQ